MYEMEVGDALKELIEELKGFVKSNDVSGAVKCLNKMAADPDDIIAAIPKSDIDEILLYVDDVISVYRIATTPKIMYPPHQHGMIAISAIYKGTETHVFYDLDGENIVERSQVRFKSPAVVDMTVDAIHAICNEDEEPNESLHIYFGDLETQKRTLWDLDGKNPQQYVQEDYESFSRPFTTE